MCAIVLQAGSQGLTPLQTEVHGNEFILFPPHQQHRPAEVCADPGDSSRETPCAYTGNRHTSSHHASHRIVWCVQHSAASRTERVEVQEELVIYHAAIPPTHLQSRQYEHKRGRETG